MACRATRRCGTPGDCNSGADLCETGGGVAGAALVVLAAQVMFTAPGNPGRLGGVLALLCGVTGLWQWWRTKDERLNEHSVFGLWLSWWPLLGVLNLRSWSVLDVPPAPAFAWGIAVLCALAIPVALWFAPFQFTLFRAGRR